tara:strand:+ start:362 stop:727 length:366 start_codon:yes stop_codon:yes gene_type:complete
MEKGKVCVTKVVKQPDIESEMTVYQDLVIEDGHKSLLKGLGVEDFDIHFEPPERCVKCKSQEIAGLIVLGCLDGILFWICNACEHLHLKYSKMRTERLLKKGEGFWTNANDWKPRTEENTN